jgi:hypothetical protein
VNVTLRRVYDTSQRTFGIMQLGIHTFTTLEDAFHIPKIAGQTRIPHGTYSIDLRTTSPMAARYATRFGKGHVGMIWIKNVPNFDFVYIHVGNKEEDTEGCVLMGRTINLKGGVVEQSVDAYKEFYPLVMAALERNEPVTITITDQFT